MNYNGITLSTTYCRHDETGERYAYVSDENGFPYEGIGSVRWEKLRIMSQGGQGWRVIGTWPVAKQPADLWSL